MNNPITYTTHYHLPTNTAVELGEDVRHMLVFCLQVAAERFRQDADACAPEPPGEPVPQATEYSRLARQFLRQVNQAQELAARIENAAFVRLGREVEYELYG